MLNISIYDFDCFISEGVVQFFFLSKGKKNIQKIIQYNFQGKFQGKDYFNLGFGDYSEEENNFMDNVCSNNGDTYKIFNTVLNSINSFFEIYPNAGIIVSGSNFQRKEIYKKYLDKNLDIFLRDYTFYGKIKYKKDFFPYSIDKKIDQILFFRKF